MSELKINGYKLIVNAVSPLAPKAIENQYKKKSPEPVQPTYTVDAAGGVVETFKHTLETVETDDEKAEYSLWVDQHEEWMSGLTYKLLALFLSQGITLHITTKQEKILKEKLDVLGLDIPESVTERNLLYLETFVIDNQASMQKVIEAVLSETGISQEALDLANATFPD